MSLSIPSLDLIRKPFHLSKTDFDLSQITQIMPDEVFAEQVEMNEKSKERIWRATEKLYKTGTQPAMDTELALHCCKTTCNNQQQRDLRTSTTKTMLLRHQPSLFNLAKRIRHRDIA